MKIFFGLVILVFLALALSAGCTGTLPDQATATPTMTMAATTVQTAAPAPAVTAEASPFPDALPLGKSYVYGGEEDGRVLTVYNAIVVPSYWFHSTEHGYAWEVKPAEGNKFLFLELKVKHNGTKTELGAPYQGSIYVWYDGQYYSYREERDGAIYRVTEPNNMDEDYYGGVLNIYDTRDGFLIFEVPESITVDRAYAQVNLGNVYGSQTWELVKS